MNHVEEVNGIVGLAPRGPYMWGGGADDHRSIRIYAGQASETAWLRRAANLALKHT